MAVGRGEPVSLVAANGSGKSAMVVAPSILAFLARYPKGKCVLVSASHRQILNQIMPALKRHAHLFPGWEFLSQEIKTPEGGFFSAFSVQEGQIGAGRAEGYHPAIDADTDPVFIIVDEGKTVGDLVFTGLDRCTRKYQLFTSSPGPDSGQFYRSHTSERQFFTCFKVTSFDCPHIDAKKIERDRIKYGADHPVFLSMHMAEFSDGDEQAIIPSSLLRTCIANPPEFVDSSKTAFFDFAAGGDENVIAIRRGNRVWIADAWHDADTMRACERFILVVRRHGVRNIYGDSSGLGAPMIDRLRQRGLYVHRVNNGAPSSDADEAYANKGTQLWFETRRIIENCEVVLDLDPQSFQQLTTRRVDFASRGYEESKLLAEPKKKMRERGLKSPDRADALVGVIANNHLGDSVPFTLETAKGIVVPRNPIAVPIIRF